MSVARRKSSAKWRNRIDSPAYQHRTRGRMDKVMALSTMDGRSLTRLMDAYASGDTAAFEPLYERFRDRLFGYLARAGLLNELKLFRTTLAVGGYFREHPVARHLVWPIGPVQQQEV